MAVDINITPIIREVTILIGSSGGGGVAVWGGITGTLSNQTDLALQQTAQDDLISTNATDIGTNVTGILALDTDVTNLETSQGIQDTAIALNTAKVSNIDHPLVETAVPIGAVFTDSDTVYDDTAIQSEVDLNTAKISFDSTSSTRLANTSGTNTGDENLTPFTGKTTADTGTVIVLDTVAGNNCNFLSANTNVAFTLTSTSIINAWAQVFINTATEPSVTGATQVGGIEWSTGDLYLYVRDLGTDGIHYAYLPSAVGIGGASGSFTSSDAKTITVVNGLITSII